MNGVIYARYSCEGQREESIEGQLRECISYAQRSGITILNTYVDRAISGKNADNRPQFQQMIKDSSKKMFDSVQERMQKNKRAPSRHKAERQRLIDSFVNAIYLYDDKPVITLNYKDGTRTISLTR